MNFCANLLFFSSLIQNKFAIWVFVLVNFLLCSKYLLNSVGTWKKAPFFVQKKKKKQSNKKVRYELITKNWIIINENDCLKRDTTMNSTCACVQVLLCSLLSTFALANVIWSNNGNNIRSKYLYWQLFGGYSILRK